MKMLKKIIAAAICGIAVASMSNHADAAGAAGFARGFAAVERSAVTQIGVSAPDGFDGCVLSAGQCVSTIAAPLTAERREELLRVNRDVNTTMGALDDYFSGLATDLPATPSANLEIAVTAPRSSAPPSPALAGLPVRCALPFR